MPGRRVWIREARSGPPREGMTTSVKSRWMGCWYPRTLSRFLRPRRLEHPVAIGFQDRAREGPDGGVPPRIGLVQLHVRGFAGAKDTLFSGLRLTSHASRLVHPAHAAAVRHAGRRLLLLDLGDQGSSRSSLTRRASSFGEKGFWRNAPPASRRPRCKTASFV